MIRTGSEADWLSPTRAWRLSECPASVRLPAGTLSAATRSTEVNSGVLAHRALNRWIAEEGYRSAHPRSALADAADCCVRTAAVAPPGDWRVTRARLLARTPSILDLVSDRPPEHVLSEIELRDEQLRLRGELDLLLMGTEVAVVDLKTQTLKGRRLPRQVEFQLLTYAHLVRATHGRLPSQVKVLSLNRGLIDIPVTLGRIDRLLETLAAVRRADPHATNPDPETCRFCPRRLRCEDHWQAAAEWPGADAVRGRAIRVENAASGVSAVLLETPAGNAWVGGIPADIAPAAGERDVRVVRVRGGVVREDGLPQWQWLPRSAIYLS